ncbi:MAG: ABC transporter ATP-binding protein [Acidobacteriaceae bacterium]|nr:ABC transporter ATP-binding protein [Acidobacteriaceae bacterium]
MSGEPAVRLQVDRVSHSYGQLEVLRNLSLEVLDGEFVAVVGPSGCGKTTLLNLLSRFDRPSAGLIEVNGQTRTVYQKDGLFPWQTVWENIALGLRRTKDKKEQERQVKELISLIRLEGFENSYPYQLSGGMRQRVELARALAGTSEVLLLDEPFSALDYLTRLRMRLELARILKERPRTVVLVTHDIEEAAQLADRIIVLSEAPAQIRFELSITAIRPRDPTHEEVVRAVHRVLTELGVESGSGEYANA